MYYERDGDAFAFIIISFGRKKNNTSSDMVAFRDREKHSTDASISQLAHYS